MARIIHEYRYNPRQKKWKVELGARLEWSVVPLSLATIGCLIGFFGNGYGITFLFFIIFGVLTGLCFWASQRLLLGEPKRKSQNSSSQDVTNIESQKTNTNNDSRNSRDNATENSIEYEDEEF